ncbi:MAG: PhoH family protein [Coriobacteriia bacterium]|nr:PhoH family protein [Coriobacteriia bacterium]
MTLPSDLDPVALLGERDAWLRLIEERFAADISVRGNLVKLCGSSFEVATLQALFSELISLVSHGETLTRVLVEGAIDSLTHGTARPSQLTSDIVTTHRGQVIRPKTAGQKAYLDAVRTHTVTFGIGPAGTGKTYLAMALAVEALKRKEVSRIILTRPAVEAGESLGFLPGSLTEKVDPYLRPLYDALFDMMDAEKSAALIERGVIEIAPLAFMRGRTLNDSFVILDEAQNTTREQMKMFLTRLGFNSRIVVTGDVTQIDLKRGRSGLKDVTRVLVNIDDIAFVELTGKDIVRHRLVQHIVAAYEEYESGSRQMELSDIEESEA